MVIIADKTCNSDLFCHRCAATFSTKDDTVRHKQRLSVPLETEPAAATTPGITADMVAIRHEPELKGAFKALQQKGLRIKDYKESVG